LPGHKAKATRTTSSDRDNSQGSLTIIGVWRAVEG